MVFGRNYQILPQKRQDAKKSRDALAPLREVIFYQHWQEKILRRHPTLQAQYPAGFAALFGQLIDNYRQDVGIRPSSPP